MNQGSTGALQKAIDVTSKVEQLYAKYRAEQDASKKMIYGYDNPDELAWKEGEERVMERVLDDLREILFPEE